MFKALGIVIAAVVVLGAAGFALVSYTGSGAVGQASELTHIRSMPFFISAERALSLDPQLNALLGGNMKFGEVVLKGKELAPDDLGFVMLDMVVSGTNGSGHARVKVNHAKLSEGWKLQGGDFFPDNGPPLHLDSR